MDRNNTLLEETVAVARIQRLAKAIYDALDQEDPGSVMVPWALNTALTIDGRFNLSSVALRLVRILSVD